MNIPFKDECMHVLENQVTTSAPKCENENVDFFKYNNCLSNRRSSIGKIRTNDKHTQYS